MTKRGNKKNLLFLISITLVIFSISFILGFCNPDDAPEFCETKQDCLNAGYEWCELIVEDESDGYCDFSCSCTMETPYHCKESECSEIGGEWCTISFFGEEEEQFCDMDCSCRVENPFYCQTEAECLGIGGEWYGDFCRVPVSLPDLLDLEEQEKETSLVFYLLLIIIALALLFFIIYYLKKKSQENSIQEVKIIKTNNNNNSKNNKK